jgi:hypothetical protein
MGVTPHSTKMASASYSCVAEKNGSYRLTGLPLLSKITRPEIIIDFNGMSERSFDIGHDHAMAAVRIYTVPGGRQAVGWRKADSANHVGV